MELEVITKTGNIEFNSEQLKTELTNALVKYQGLVYDDKSITFAKADRARLNSLRNQIEDERKKAKKKWNTPYVEFEQKTKELIALVSEPITAIDAQVKTYEEKRKAEKRKSLEAYFNSTIGDNKLLLKFEDIFDEKWLNVTVSEKKACEEIKGCIVIFETDLSVIAEESGEFKTQLYDYFLRTRSLSLTFKEKQRLIATKEAMEQLKARETERKAVEPPTQEDKPPQFKISFEVEGTVVELGKLKEYLNTNNLSYRRI